MTLKRKAIYVSWQGFATKRIIIIKRPKIHVSLKRKKKNKSKFTQEERSWECSVEATTR